MNTMKHSISALALIAALPAAAQDQEVDLGEIILSANRGTETPVDETTVSVSVVTEEDIRDKIDVNTQVGDILARSVPGMSPSTENMTDYGQTLRGRNFLTLIDGVPQTNTLNNDYRSLNSIGASAIGQVEVVRGATAAYGFGGSGGIVNIVTKRPEDGEGRTRLSYGMRFQPEHFEDTLSHSLSMSTSKRMGNFDYLLSLGLEKTGGSFTPDGTRRPPDSYGTQGGLDDIENANALVKLGYEVDQHRLEFSANLYEYEQDSNYAGRVSGGSVTNGTSATPARGDLNTRTPGISNRTFNVKYHNDDLLGGTMDLQVYRTDKTTTFTRTEFQGLIFNQYETESEKTGARLTFNTPIGTSFNAAWGIDLLNDKTVVNPIDTPISGYPDMEMTGYAPFVQASYDIGGRGTLTAGVRYESLEVKVDDFVNESLTLVQGGDIDFDEPLLNISGSYDLTDHVTVYGGWGQAFELGSLARALANGTITQVDGDTVTGKKTESYELGLRGEYGALRYSGVAFYSQSSNGETYDSNLDLVLSPERIHGLEFTLDYDAGNGVELGGTATFMEGRYDAAGDGRGFIDLGSDRIPPTKLTLYMLYNYDHSSYRLDMTHVTRRDPDSTQYTGIETTDAYTVVDASARFDLGKGQLSVGIDNVFDTTYVPVLARAFSVQPLAHDDYYHVQGQGRRFSVSYSMEF